MESSEYQLQHRLMAKFAPPPLFQTLSPGLNNYIIEVGGRGASQKLTIAEGGGGGRFQDFS